MIIIICVFLKISPEQWCKDVNEGRGKWSLVPQMRCTYILQYLNVNLLIHTRKLQQCLHLQNTTIVKHGILTDQTFLLNVAISVDNEWKCVLQFVR